MSVKKELSEGLADGDKLSIIKVLKDSFPNISKAITGVSSAWSSGTTIMSKASGVAKASISGLWGIIKAHPIVSTVAVLGTLYGILKKVGGAAREASEEADELKAKAAEEAQSAKEEVNQLDELISKYKELAQSDTQDASTRDEIKGIQEQIVDLVGQQAQGLDLVNGKLDDEISKLEAAKKATAESAVDKAVAAYHTAKDSQDKAIGSSSPWYTFGTGSYAYVGDGWWDDQDAEIVKILKNFGYGYHRAGEGGVDTLNGTIQTGGFLDSEYLISDNYDKNGKELKGAAEKAEFLNEMINVIKDNYSDYASSDMYNSLVTQREAYLKYVEDVKNAAQDVAEAILVSSEYDAELGRNRVNSLETYSEYRDKLIDLVKNSPDLSEVISSGDLSNDDVAKSVDNYLATISEFSDYYEKLPEKQEIENKIQDIKSVFANSNKLQDSDWKTAEKELQAFNDWVDNLSTDDKEIVYKIFCDTDTAEYSLKDWQDALENYSSYVDLTIGEINKKVSSELENTQSLIGSISSAQNILSSQSTGSSASLDEFFSDELKDYRSALEYVNGTMQLNADKVNEIAKAKAEEQVAINNTNKSLAQSQYLKNAKQIEDYRASLRNASFSNANAREQIEDSIDALLEENSAIAETCDQYDLLSSSILEAVGAYQDWLNAQNASDYGDMADDAVSAIQRIRDTYDQNSEIYGEYGSKKFDAAVEFIVPDSVDSDDLAAIEKYMANFKQYLNFDDEGAVDGLNIDAFLHNSVDAGLMSYSKDDGFKILGNIKMEDFVEGLKMSSGMVQSFFDELQLKGGEFSWADEADKTIGDLAVSANVAAENLRELHQDMVINLDVSDLDSLDEKNEALDDTIKQMQKHKATVGIDTSEIEYANSIITYCVTQKQMLENPAILDIDTTKVAETSKSASEAIGLLQEFKTEYNNLQLQKALKVDTTQAQAKVDELFGKIKSSDNDYIINLDLNTESAETVNSAISQMDVKAIKTYFKIEDKDLKSYQPEDKEATVTYHKISTSVDNYNPQNLIRTVTYLRVVEDENNTNAKSNGFNFRSVSSATSATNNLIKGLAGTSDTANVAGTAMVGGNWGTALGGKTLVGELGRKILRRHMATYAWKLSNCWETLKLYKLQRKNEICLSVNV